LYRAGPRLEAANFLASPSISHKTAGLARTPALVRIVVAEFNRLGPITARQILMVAGALERDYPELSSEQVRRLLLYADQYRYPKPSNAAGPRGRYWHAYLLRRAAKAEARR
jgi:hypothetical protein